MPDLRSDKKASDVLELQAYFDKAIKTLASKDDIESIKSLISEQNKIIEVLNGKVKDLENISRSQNEKIFTLEEKIDKLEYKFKGEISFLKNNIVLTDRKNDDLEQYGRRTSLRTDGLEFKEGETASQFEDKVKKFIKGDLNLNVSDNELFTELEG